MIRESVRFLNESAEVVRPMVLEEKAVSETHKDTDNEMCKDDNTTQRQPLITVGVDFATILRKWENSGREKDIFMRTWADLQLCIDKARCILETVANIDNTDASLPVHG